MPKQVSERTLLFLIGAVQFVNVLDFMMVMPLGPDFARGLDIPTAHLGYIGGAYTASAAISGLVGSLFLDRFDRRRVLGLAMLGLVLGTLAGGFATGLTSLMAARIVAGFFGGPATSISLSIIADVIPPERRGKAMGAVMGAFSVASVLGVPLGLELAQVGSWRTPFFAVAGLGLVIAALAVSLMPSMTEHIRAARGKKGPRVVDILRRPIVQLSLAATATIMVAMFAVIPNLAAYLQQNLGYPRERLGLLYLVGGSVSFFAMRLIGGLVDRIGSPRVAAIGTAVFIGDLIVLFLFPSIGVPVMIIFVLFMVAGAFRNVSMSALTSRVPLPNERARFMSLQSAVQHLAAAAGAFLSASMLTELPDLRLEGMDRVSVLSIGLSFMLPFLLFAVESRVRAREASERAQVPPVAPQMVAAEGSG